MIRWEHGNKVRFSAEDLNTNIGHIKVLYCMSMFTVFYTFYYVTLEFLCYKKKARFVLLQPLFFYFLPCFLFWLSDKGGKKGVRKLALCLASPLECEFER